MYACTSYATSAAFQHNQWLPQRFDFLERGATLKESLLRQGHAMHIVATQAFRNRFVFSDPRRMRERTTTEEEKDPQSF